MKTSAILESTLQLFRVEESTPHPYLDSVAFEISCTQAPPFSPCTSPSPSFHTVYTRELWGVTLFWILVQTKYLSCSQLLSFFQSLLSWNKVFTDAFYSKVLDHMTGRGVWWWFSLLFICWLCGLFHVMLWKIIFFVLCITLVVCACYALMALVCHIIDLKCVCLCEEL